MSETFDDLSQFMTSEEKKALLGRIQASLNFSSKDTDSIISKADGPDELRVRLTKEFGKLGFFDRLVIKMAAFFSSRPEYELLGERKLAGAKATLRDRVPDLVSFPKQEWSPEFARLLYDFYFEATLLKPLFDLLFQQKITLEAGLMMLIREEHPAAIQTLDDLFPDREISELYRQDQKRAPLLNQLDQRLEAYLDGIPGSVFDRVKERLRPLYYLRPLIQFPYGFLMELFGHSPDKVEPSKYPYFTGAPWRKAAGLLERFHYGLYLCTKIDSKDLELTQIGAAAAEKISNEKSPWSVELINQRLSALIRLAQDTSRRVPWKEILQWSFQDPYYTVKYVLPKFSIRDFYQATLSMTLHEEMDDLIPELRQRLLGEERSVLFQNGSFEPLSYYVPGVGSVSQKIRGFQYPETLGLLWGFLSHHFATKISPFYQSLARMVAPASKSTLQGLSNVVEELTALKSKISQLDHSLHPDTEEGKDFAKLKYELGSKALSLKPFLQLVQNKDAQALELVNRGLEGIQILFNQLSGVRDRNIPALKAVLSLPYLLEGQQETIENGLDRLLVIIKKTLFVLREAQSLES